MATLLITGFEPFGGFAVNPSQEIVKHLSRNGKPAGAVTAILPVDAAQVPGMITESFARSSTRSVPDAWSGGWIRCAFGRAGGDQSLRFSYPR